MQIWAERLQILYRHRWLWNPNCVGTGYRLYTCRLVALARWSGSRRGFGLLRGYDGEPWWVQGTKPVRMTRATIILCIKNLFDHVNIPVENTHLPNGIGGSTRRSASAIQSWFSLLVVLIYSFLVSGTIWSYRFLIGRARVFDNRYTVWI